MPRARLAPSAWTALRLGTAGGARQRATGGASGWSTALTAPRAPRPAPRRYYIRPGVGADASKYKMHFKGGGWCMSDESCYSRSQVRALECSAGVWFLVCGTRVVALGCGTKMCGTRV